MGAMREVRTTTAMGERTYSAKGLPPALWANPPLAVPNQLFHVRRFTDCRSAGAGIPPTPGDSMALRRVNGQSHRRTPTGLAHQRPAGGTGAFVALYDKTVNRVFGLIMAVVGEAGEAEKLTMDVYEDLCRGIGDVDLAGVEAQRWVVAVAHLRAVEHRRAQRRAAAACDPADGRLAGLPRPSVLDTLEPVTSQLIRLTYFGGHTCQHAAALLGLSAAAARERLRIGLLALDPGHDESARTRPD